MVSSDAPTISATVPAESDSETLTGHDVPRAHEPVKLQRGAPIGRYVILARVGSGGMGTVYSAYDPELDRKVAVKLMHLETGDQTQANRRRTRLLREAQAMARIAHPHVVAVHDVGTIRDDIFVAMEFVDGTTLTEWAPKHRAWREIVAMFAQAGRGLAAAHAKGLVHRDFKPDNVLIGEDGRARVTDFGLARAMSELADDTTAELRAETPVPEDDLLMSPLTLTGALMGTPAYMSPEQFLGQPADARSDQFSFCVALWEALYGERPFAGEQAAALSIAVTQGELRAPPRGTDVPFRIRRVLERGLARAPSARFPDMQALLDALRSDPARRWRRIGMAAGAVALVGGLAFGLSRVDTGAQVCQAGPAQLDGVWDDGVRRRVAESFSAIGRGYADSTLVTVTGALDAYAAQWVDAYVDACEATHVRGEQSSELLDLRMGCLQERRAALEELTSRLAEADENTVRRAARAVEQLGSISACADRDALMLPVRPPDDPQVRESIEDVERKLGRIRAVTSLGHYREALELADMAEEQAQAIGYRPLIADAGYELGILQWLNDDPKLGAQTLEASFHEAIAARHDLRAEECAADLVHIYGGDLEQGDLALNWAAHARGLLLRLGRDPETDARLTNAMGIVYEEKGAYERALALYEASAQAREAEFGHADIGVANAINNVAMIYEIQNEFDQALEKHREAMDIRRALGGDEHPDVGDSHNNIGLVLSGIGRLEEARGEFERAIEIYDAALGEGSLTSASPLNNLGSLIDRLGEEEKALELYARALEIRERELGSDNAQVASILKNQGNTLIRLERFDEARPILERALEIQRKQLGPEHAYTSETLLYLGDIDRYTEHYEEAAVRYREALRILDKAFPDGHGMTAQVRLHLARAVRDGGDRRAAVPLFEQALEMSDRILGPKHSMTGNVLDDLGELHEEAGRDAEAVPLLERALEIRKTELTPPAALGNTLFALAKALPESEVERRRSLADEAKEAYREAEKPDRVAEVEAFRP